MTDVITPYHSLCVKHGIPFDKVDSVLSYDSSTLFCPAGMQKYKKDFGEVEGVTVANIQKCLRLNDFDELSDGVHALSFDMIGLFSFKDWPITQAIRFFEEYLEILGIIPDFVTIHPDKEEWEHFFSINTEVRLSEDCKWSDGQIGGYCTEFFVKRDGESVEIGNIVNPLGHSIDVGFGKERLEYILGAKPLTELEQLEKAGMDIVNSGIKPSANNHGYVLRKILRRIADLKGASNNPYFNLEIKRRGDALERYNKLKEKHHDKTPAWWYDTHGIDVGNL